MAGQEQSTQTIRLPLVGTEHAYGAARSGQSWNFKDQILVNCFPTVGKDPLTSDSGEVKILSRPGLMNPESGNNDLGTTCLAPAGSMPSAEPVATLGVKGLASNTLVTVYWMFDGTALQYQLRVVSYVPGGTSVLIGTVNLTSYGSPYSAGQAPLVHLTQIVNGAGLPGIAMTFHPRTYSASTSANSDMYYAITAAGVFTAASLLAIADADFPTNTPAKGLVGAVQQLNNVHYVMTVDGYIYGSYPSLVSPFNPDITTWNSSGNTATYQNPDGGAGLIRYKHHLLAFGQNSCEFFNDEALAQPSLPIRRTQQAFFKIGLLNARSYVHVDDDLYFLGCSSDTNFIGLYRLSGYTPELISSTPMNNAFQNRSHYIADLQTISIHGTRQIITNCYHEPLPRWQQDPLAEIPTNSLVRGTWVYCIDSKAWWLWSFDIQDGSAAYGGSHRLYVARTASGLNSYQYVYAVINGYGSSRDNYSLHPCAEFSYHNISLTASYDKFRKENTNGPVLELNYTIPIMLVTNRFDLGTMDRKTINRIRLLSDRPYNITGQEPMTTFTGIGHTLTMALFKDEAADNTIATSPYSLIAKWDVPTLINNPTMNWNNLGTMRKFKLVIQVNTWTLWRFEGLEVTVTKGVH